MQFQITIRNMYTTHICGRYKKYVQLTFVVVIHILNTQVLSINIIIENKGKYCVYLFNKIEKLRKS